VYKKVNKMDSPEIKLRAIGPSDHDLIAELMRREWGAETVVGHGTVYFPAELQRFLAESEGKVVGFLTYVIDIESCEVVTINSLSPGTGIGSRLIKAVRGRAVEMGCQRLWLVTTYDNLNALGFYQKRGFRLADLRPGAVDESRKIKPEIPLIAENGIPIHDEIELETICEMYIILL
jgi:N-acetylglutamate synthase-like GNAT family acetyltransferase